MGLKYIKEKENDGKKENNKVYKKKESRGEKKEIINYIYKYKYKYIYIYIKMGSSYT